MLIFPVSISSKFWVPATSVLVEESSMGSGEIIMETIFNGIRRDYYGNQVVSILLLLLKRLQWRPLSDQSLIYMTVYDSDWKKPSILS